MSGKVETVGTARAAGEPVEARDAIEIRPVVGVVGDRYGEDAGHFKGYPDQEVTLVEAEDAEAAGMPPLALRRNIVTRGVALESLIGRAFRVGDEVVLHGMRVCLPCRYLEGVAKSPGLKERIRGGLRARVVQGGVVRVGDAVEPVTVRLDEDMRAIVAAARLAFVATVTADGRPNLSPKGTIRVLDERRLFFLDIASPQTRKDLATSPWMEINVVDALSRRGYRFYGQAAIHEGDDVHRAAQAIVFRDDVVSARAQPQRSRLVESAARAHASSAFDNGATYENRGAIVLTVERALPLVSPGYDVPDTDERNMREAWKKKRAALDASFEAHVDARGPFRLR